MPWLALALTAPAVSDAQQERLSGSVILDGSPVSEAPVTLHRVTADSSGIVTSTRTSGDGRFAFVLPPPDTGSFTVYFATAEHAGVRYFGVPVHPGDTIGDYTITVRDTASAIPGAVRIPRRDLVLVPHAGGGWEVNEVVRISNTSSRTLVGRGGMPTVQVAIPSGAEAFEAGAGDLPADQVQQMGDRALLTAPLLPGERDLFLRYRLPGSGTADLRIIDAADTLNLFVQQPSPHITVTGLQPVEIVTVDGQRYLQLSGHDFAADATLRLRWEGDGPPIDPVVAGVGATVLLLLVGVGAALRNRAA